MSRILNIKTLMFVFVMVIVFSILRVDDTYAYGDRPTRDIAGKRYTLYTDYEIQEQYISGGYLYIEGFYIVKHLQNFVTKSGTSRTHTYQLIFGDKTYNDIGGNYIDLTMIDYTYGWQWATESETAIATPGQKKNYRLKDVGFRFRIPLSDLTNFSGTSSDFQMSVIVNCYNTVAGKGVNVQYVQKNVYAAKELSDITASGGYRFSFISNLGTARAKISNDPAYVRSSANKDAQVNVKTYNGNKLYWNYTGEFRNFSNSSYNSSEKITWYYIQYGLPPAYDGARHRVSYSTSSGVYGWIPSIFFTGLTGDPYIVRVYNTAPTISASNKSYTESTYITDTMLKSGVSASDSQDGNITNKIRITNRGGISSTVKAKAGSYTVSFAVTDSNNLTTTRNITVNVTNVAPTINASNKTYELGTNITSAMLFSGVSASDIYDGNLTSSVRITNYGGLQLNSNNAFGKYNVTYAVTDSNNATSTKTVVVTIGITEYTVEAKEPVIHYVGDLPVDQSSNIRFMANGADVTQYFKITRLVHVWNHTNYRTVSIFNSPSTGEISYTYGYMLKGTTTEKFFNMPVTVYDINASINDKVFEYGTMINWSNLFSDLRLVTADNKLIYPFFQTGTSLTRAANYNGFFETSYKTFNINSSTNAVGTYRIGMYYAIYGNTAGGYLPRSIVFNVTIIPKNTAPVLSNTSKTFAEATSLTNAMILNGVTATDAEDGNITNKIRIVHLGGLDLLKPKPGVYTVTTSVSDSLGLTATSIVRVTITNVLPTINAGNKTFVEGTYITDEMLLEGVSAYDPYDGDITSNVFVDSREDLANSMTMAKVGVYEVLYFVNDSTGSGNSKSISVTITNVAPEIYASDKYFDDGIYITDEMLLEGVSAYDVYDGDITNKVVIKSRGTLPGATQKSREGIHNVTYSVTDSNGYESTIIVKVNIYGSAPYIEVIEKTYSEGVFVTDQMLLEDVKAYDTYDGDVSSSIEIINRGELAAYNVKAKVGTYFITYSAKDSEGNIGEGISIVYIENILPVINAEDKTFAANKYITDEMLLEDVSAYDPYDGDITNKVIIKSRGTLSQVTQKSIPGIYQVTYSVTDSNNSTSEITVNVFIDEVIVRARYISLKYLYTLNPESKWATDPILNQKLVNTLQKAGTNEEAFQIWTFTSSDIAEIKEFNKEQIYNRDANKLFLEKFSRCRVK